MDKKNTMHVDFGGIFPGSDGKLPMPHCENMKLITKIIDEETEGLECYAYFNYLPEQNMVRECYAKSKGISLDRIVAIEYKINKEICLLLRQ